MRTCFYITLIALLSLRLHAQQSDHSKEGTPSLDRLTNKESTTAITPDSDTLPFSVVTYELAEKTWFTDRLANAVVWFDEAVEVAEDSFGALSDINILEIKTLKEPNTKSGRYAAVIRFIPRHNGEATLPQITFSSDRRTYKTRPISISVSQPIRSENMSLSLSPEKQSVYVGEALKLKLSWTCSLNATELKSLKLYPDFFNNASIDVVIPRNTSEENTHVGIPIGGRRVIATRTLPNDESKALGTIDLVLYLRFTEPGNYTLPETRLECIRLKKADSDFARYAAHFNNGLFEAVEADQLYTRIYAVAPAIDIIVKPLPVNDSGLEYSGLVAPIDFEVSINPTELEIGQILEMDIKVSGNTPHNMIELPTLSHQAGLRERFLVDNDLNRIWHSEGTLFRTYLRPLSTTIQALPALHFLILNPNSGVYETHSTEAIPLKTLPSEGRSFIPLKNYKGASITLTNQPEGIWHNLKVNRMNDILNTLFDSLSRHFWLCIALGPFAFICLRPIVNNQRRRAYDHSYRLRMDAYNRFKRATKQSPEKWTTFLNFMAVNFEKSGKAWTMSDSINALKTINASDTDIENIVRMHKDLDARDFSSSSNEVTFSQLDSVAKQILKSISKLSIILLLAGHSLTPKATAANWSEAEHLFTQAQNGIPGSEAANALYQQAALKFQAEATIEKHPGESWVNAGNAWFKAGATGRAIAAYRNALNYRPFDSKLTENLAAARAMTLNEIPENTHWWQRVPLRWLKATTVIANLIFWIGLLFWIRYRNRQALIFATFCTTFLLFVSVFLLQRAYKIRTAGVIIADVSYAKKGPSHAYANAFNEPLHDGAEFIVLENQENWSFVEFSDGRRAWVLSSQTTTFTQ